MSIEISSNGISKTYRFYPQDALYVDANGNVNTSGSGRQVTEVWANGEKCYPDVETFPKGTTRRAVVTGGLEGLMTLESQKTVGAVEYNNTHSVVGLERVQYHGIYGTEEPLAKKTIRFSMQYEAVVSSTQNISYREAQNRPGTFSSNRASWTGELWYAPYNYPWNIAIVGNVIEDNTSYMVIDVARFNLEHIAVKVSYDGVFYENLMFYVISPDYYSPEHGHMRQGNGHSNVSYASYEYTGSLPNRLGVDEDFTSTSVDLGFRSNSGSETFVGTTWHYVDENRVQFGSGAPEQRATACYMRFMLQHDHIYNIADDSDYIPHF